MHSHLYTAFGVNILNSVKKLFPNSQCISETNKLNLLLQSEAVIDSKKKIPILLSATITYINPTERLSFDVIKL